MENLTENQKKLFETSIFLAKLIASGIIFQLILFLYPDTSGIQSIFADIISLIFQSLGFPSTSKGIFISIESSLYQITQDCLGWKSIAAFLSLAFASKTKIRKNLSLIMLSIAILIGANIFRVFTTVYLSHKGFISFDIIHGILWKWGLTFIVFILWINIFRQNRGTFK